MRTLLSVVALGALTSGSVFAATSFTNNLGDSNFLNSGNWDNGVPTDTNIGTINGEKTAKLGVDHSASLIVGQGGSQSRGYLHIDAGVLTIGAGDLKVGDGGGSYGEVVIHEGAGLSTTTEGTTIFLGYEGGSGHMTVESGGTFDMKGGTLQVNNGWVRYEPRASSSVHGVYVVGDTKGGKM